MRENELRSGCAAPAVVRGTSEERKANRGRKRFPSACWEVVAAQSPELIDLDTWARHYIEIVFRQLQPPELVEVA